MAYYHHRERYIADEVPIGAIIKFPTPIASSLNLSSYRYVPPYKEMSPEEWSVAIKPNTDILYTGCNLGSEIKTDIGCGFGEFEGAFHICLPGTYLLSWSVSQISGQAADGQYFQLKYYDYKQGEWLNFSEAGGRLLVSSSFGTAIVNITEERLGPLEKFTIALFNNSLKPLQMNRSCHMKAAFAIFGFSVASAEVIETIIQKILEMIGDCCNDTCRMTRLKERVTNLIISDNYQDWQLVELWEKWLGLYEDFLVHISPKIRNAVVDFPNLILYYIRTGYVYNFWTEGRMIPKDCTGGTVLNPAKYMLISSASFEILQHFSEAPSVGTAYFEYVSGTPPVTTTFFEPVFLDSTGIYFMFTQRRNFPNDTICRVALMAIIPWYDPNQEE